MHIMLQPPFKCSRAFVHHTKTTYVAASRYVENRLSSLRLTPFGLRRKDYTPSSSLFIRLDRCLCIMSVVGRSRSRAYES